MLAWSPEPVAAALGAAAGGIVVGDGCYNAKPMSMRAALDQVSAPAAGRRSDGLARAPVAA